MNEAKALLDLYCLPSAKADGKKRKITNKKPSTL